MKKLLIRTKVFIVSQPDEQTVEMGYFTECLSIKDAEEVLNENYCIEDDEISCYVDYRIENKDEILAVLEKECGATWEANQRAYAERSTAHEATFERREREELARLKEKYEV